MKISELAKRGFATTKRFTYKHSPELLLGGGLLLGAAGVYFACRETLALDTALTPHKDHIDQIKESFTEEEKKEMSKALIAEYGKTALTVVKTYAPAAVCLTGSTAMILASHGIIRKRYAALGAAYTALDKSFKTYRQRVVEKAGEAADRYYMYGTETKTETTVDESGKKKKEKVEVINKDDFLKHPWNRIFDKSNPNWDGLPENNRRFLANVEAEAQRKLRTDGVLWLNDVYKMLGFQKTVAGQDLGWIFDDVSGYSPSFVSFGVFDNNATGAKLRFREGVEPCVGLEFNCVFINDCAPIETV